MGTEAVPWREDGQGQAGCICGSWGHVWGGSQPAPLPSFSASSSLPDLLPPCFPGTPVVSSSSDLSMCSLELSVSHCPPLLLPASLSPCGTPTPSYSPCPGREGSAPFPCSSSPHLRLLLSHPLPSSQFLRNLGETEERSLLRVGGARGESTRTVSLQ